MEKGKIQRGQIEKDAGGVTGRRKSALFPNTCEFDNKLAGSFRRRTVAYPGPAVPRDHVRPRREKSIFPLGRARCVFRQSETTGFRCAALADFTLSVVS